MCAYQQIAVDGFQSCLRVPIHRNHILVYISFYRLHEACHTFFSNSMAAILTGSSSFICSSSSLCLFRHFRITLYNRFFSACTKHLEYVKTSKHNALCCRYLKFTVLSSELGNAFLQISEIFTFELSGLFCRLQPLLRFSEIVAFSYRLPIVVMTCTRGL